MTLYLTDEMPPGEIDALKTSGFIHAVKLYPAGATTNSAAGVTDLGKCRATLARMETLGVPLLVHGEATDPAVDVFDREAVFIDSVLDPLRRDFPGLRIVFEVSTWSELLKKYKQVLVPEMNSGQLRQMLRAEFLARAAD